MNSITSYFIPVFILFVLVFALCKKVNIWSAFTQGGMNGLKCSVEILPSLLGLVVAVELLYQSGALEAFSAFASPVCKLLGIPSEILPLSLMRTVSGSGSMAVFQNILSTHSPDSYIGRCASVIMGSTETTFYTLSIYFATTRAKKIRHCLFCALLADITGSIVGCLICRFI